MPSLGRKGLSQIILDEDRAAISGLRTVSDYDPRNLDASLTQLEGDDTACDTAEEELRALLVRLAALRDKVRDLQYDRHDHVVLMREQVIGQYGSDSDAAQAVGLKKKSERKRPVRKAKASG